VHSSAGVLSEMLSQALSESLKSGKSRKSLELLLFSVARRHPY
jgi:ABC-type Na+ efflux pump permease subunit